MSDIEAHAWSNGSPTARGGGYGLRVSAADRDLRWPSIVLTLPNGESIEANLSPSFWKRCREIRSAAIGRWLVQAGLAPWPRRRPPVVWLKFLTGNRFRVEIDQLIRRS